MLLLKIGIGLLVLTAAIYMIVVVIKAIAEYCMKDITRKKR